MAYTAYMKIPATVGILTFNSGATLRRALESVKDFEDIVLCDGGSTDDTLEIARAFGARVITQDAQFKNPNGTLKNFGGVRQQLLDAAKYDWFLYIDSDESVPEGLREEVQAIVSKEYKAGDPLVYRVPIGIMHNGRFLKYSSSYPGYQHRFFNKKSGAHFIKPVHERIEFDRKNVPIGTLKNPWYVYTTNDDWNRYLFHTAGYRKQQVLMYADRPWSAVWSDLVVRGVRITLGAIGKSTWQYLRHGFKYSVPIRGEIGRALSPVYLLLETVAYKLRKHE